jgi:hypothetical protein
MTRGQKPTIKLDSAKKFANRQGYRWVPNPDDDMPFDAIAYREGDLIVVRVRVLRRSMGEYDLYEDFFRNDFDILKSLPFPPSTQRELWVRYTWSRKFIRYRVLNDWLIETSFIDRDPPVFSLKRTGRTTTDPPGRIRAGTNTLGRDTPK